MARIYTRRTTIARLCEKSTREDRGYLTPCRVFTGPLRDGYGAIGVPVSDNPRARYADKRAHVVVYEHVFGPVLPGRELHHRCGQRDCHEPLHLVELTRAEHMREHLPTHCPHGHEFTPENTYTTPAGVRHCRTCNRAQMREYQQRKRAAL